ncbi:MAG: D-alanyl-D-alanine carboxypeptidase, partial [Betaproteobacteria bacterium]|nr:D-alanyl-D-alanine carboxypeptidase [Betaproteobacteria bacterium]
MSVQSFVAACSAACLLALSPLAQAAPTAAAAPAATTPAPSAVAAPLTPMQSMLATVPPPKLDARAWLVVDLTSGQILAEHDAHAQEAPASLTKLMTAYLT